FGSSSRSRLFFSLLGERVRPRTAPGVAPAFTEFEANGFYVLGGYYLIAKKLQAVVKWEHLNPGQVGNDGIESITGGLNYYIHGEGLELMANYVHTSSDFREANPEFLDDPLDVMLFRLLLLAALSVPKVALVSRFGWFAVGKVSGC